MYGMLYVMWQAPALTSTMVPGTDLSSQDALCTLHCDSGCRRIPSQPQPRARPCQELSGAQGGFTGILVPSYASFHS